MVCEADPPRAGYIFGIKSHQEVLSRNILDNWGFRRSPHRLCKPIDRPAHRCMFVYASTAFAEEGAIAGSGLGASKWSGHQRHDGLTI
jgi:hypothetical protein